MVAFIDAHREEYGVEPICAVLPIAPSTYYLHKQCAVDATRRSPRAQRDAVLRDDIQRVWTTHQEVYGVRKVWRQLRREQIVAPRCAVERLMRSMELRGVVRGGRRVRTTVPEASAEQPLDLVIIRAASARGRAPASYALERDFQKWGRFSTSHRRLELLYERPVIHRRHTIPDPPSRTSARL